MPDTGEVHLYRVRETATATLGVLVHPGDTTIPPLMVLELPWRDNAPDISRIPAGTYSCRRITSPSKGVVFEVQGVPQRAHILLHRGNTVADTEGCLLVGMGADPAGTDTIVASALAFEKLMRRHVGDDAFTLVIRNPVVPLG